MIVWMFTCLFTTTGDLYLQQWNPAEKMSSGQKTGYGKNMAVSQTRELRLQRSGIDVGYALIKQSS